MGRAPTKAQQSEHKVAAASVAQHHGLEAAEPGCRPSQRRLQGVALSSAFPHSSCSCQHDSAVVSEGGIDVLCPRSLCVGQHCGGRVLTSTEAKSGFGRTHSDGFELCRG